MKKIEERNEFKTMVQVGKISCNLLHDLISPITSLSLYTDTVVDENLKSVIDPIAKSTENIREFIKLIQDAIDKPDKHFRIKINDTIRHSLSLSKHKIITNNVEAAFITNISDNMKLLCKKIEIYQLIINLVGNAVDACSETKKSKKKIQVRLKSNKASLILTVTDNGCGISEKNINKIFKQDFTTKNRGMGIGLHTVKSIAEKSFSGTISVQSKLKVGTKFTIKLPIGVLLS